MTQEEKDYKEMKRLAHLWVLGKATMAQRLRHSALSEKIYSPTDKQVYQLTKYRNGE